MITPFGRPQLLVASKHEPILKSLTQFIRLFLGPELPHHFPDENIISLTCIDDLHTRLDLLDRHEIFNAVCIVDLTGDEPQWNIGRKQKGLRAPELILRYPEVYLIFLEGKQPTFGTASTHPSQYEAVSKQIFDHHFVKFDNFALLLDRLKRHANGFRTYFDPTAFRWLVKLKTDKENANPDRHSAPFQHQVIANNLVKRAHKIRQLASTTVEGIHAALLALEAWTILERQTLALSLDALNIMHQMEALAECAFIGASSSLPVEQRFCELDEQISSLRLHGVKTQDQHDSNSYKLKYACTIDEEENFTLLNGYILYTYDYNTFLVPTFSEMIVVLDNKQAVTFSVVMEDIDIRFGDVNEVDEQTFAVKLDDFAVDVFNRAKNYPKLSSCKYRILVSSQPVSRLIKEAYRRLEEGNEEKAKYNLKSIIKPYGGCFHNELFDLLGGKRRRALGNYNLHAKSPSDNRVWERQRLSALLEIAGDLRSVYRQNDQMEEEDIALAKIRAYALRLRVATSGEYFAGVIKFFVKSRSKLITNVKQLISYTAIICRKPSKCLNDIYYLLTQTIKRVLYFPVWYFNKLVSSFANILIGIFLWMSIFVVVFSNCSIPDENKNKIPMFTVLTFVEMQPAINLEVIELQNAKTAEYKITEIRPIPIVSKASETMSAFTAAINSKFDLFVANSNITNKTGYELDFNSVLFSLLLCAYVHLGIFISYLYQKVTRK